MGRNKQAKHSKASLYPLFEVYANSKESRHSFCERHGISLHNYNYWWAKYRKEKGLVKSKPKNGSLSNQSVVPVASSLSPNPTVIEDSGGEFIALDIPMPSASSHLDLEIGGEIRLHFHELPPVAYLKTLLSLS